MEGKRPSRRWKKRLMLGLDALGLVDYKLDKLEKLNARARELAENFKKFVAENGYYLGSPEWQAVLTDGHAELTRLTELAQGEYAVPSVVQAWSIYSKVLENSAKIMQDVKPLIRPMADDLWPLCPLWVALDRHLGRDEYVEARMNPWSSAVGHWLEVRDNFGRDATGAFGMSLSSTQRTSYQLLEDWWSASYCNPGLVEAARSYIDRQREANDRTRHPGSKSNLQSSAEAMTESSLYHASCFRLFLLEFHPLDWEPYLVDQRLLSLQMVRSQTAYIATCQRLAYAASPTSTRPQSLGYPNVQLQENVWIGRLDRGSRPRYLWDVDRGRTIEPANLDQFPDYVCVSHTWGRWRVQPAPGVALEDTQANINGVPWPVPRNTVFDVEEVPRRLARLGYRYVWLDLLCIPQDDARIVDKNIEISRQAAIFRGATSCVAWLHDVRSWQGLSASLEWMGLTFLLSTNRAADITALRPYRDSTWAGATANTGLMRQKEGQLEFDIISQPSYWFSSLWTLQETVLCPNMTLCNRYWEPLIDAWAVPIPLKSLLIFLSECFYFCAMDEPLRDVSMIDAGKYCDAAQGAWKQRQSSEPPHVGPYFLPKGPYDLFMFCAATQLNQVIITESPINVCREANRRQNKRSRAPAIMSALGVTEWYKPEEEHQATQGLVLGMYPLAFLHEAARKFGPLFFDSHATLLGFSIREELRQRKVHGSMLPFSDQPMTVGRELESLDVWDSRWDITRDVLPVTYQLEGKRIRCLPHPSVAKWRINSDGTLSIKSAGILASSLDSGCFEAPSVAKIDLGQECGQTVNISLKDPERTNLKRVTPSGYRLYAVSLYESLADNVGVVLLAAGDQPPTDGPDYLFKVGRSMTVLLASKPSVMPSETQVNWLVL